MTTSPISRVEVIASALESAQQRLELIDGNDEPAIATRLLISDALIASTALRNDLASLVRDLGPIANELWNARGAHTPADLKALASRIMAAAEPAQRAIGERA